MAEVLVASELCTNREGWQSSGEDNLLHIDSQEECNRGEGPTEHKSDRSKPGHIIVQSSSATQSNGTVN